MGSTDSPAGRAGQPSRAADVLLCALFIAACCAVVGDALARPPATRDWAAEKRAPPAAPGLPTSLAGWNALPRRLEEWWSLALGGREFLLGTRTRAMILLGAPPARDLLADEAGWLWYDPPAAFSARRGTSPFDAAAMGRFADALRSSRELCEAQGVRYGFVVCPDKETVHADRRAAERAQVLPSRREQFRSQVARLAQADVLDLAPALVDEARHDAPGDPTYFALGTHWTPRGSWRAGVECASWLAALEGAPEPRLAARDELWRPPLAPEHHDSWAGALHAKGALLESVPDAAPPGGFAWRLASSEPGQQRFVRGDGSGRRILLCADSFGPYLATWLAEFAGEVVVAAPSSLSEELLRATRPDWCLHVVVERQLASAPPGVRRPVRELRESELAALPVAARAVLDPAHARARGATRLALASSGLRARHGDSPLDGVVLALPPRSTASVLVLELLVERPGALRVAWRGGADQDFLRLRSHEVQLPAGRALVALELSEQDLQGSVLLSGRGLDYLVVRAEWRDAR
jgi:hypothetical protein